MPEHMPPGYKKNDSPLDHAFFYKNDLNLATNAQALMETYMRTSVISADPSTIEVNNRNTAFAKETGPLIGFDSIVQFIDIRTTLTLTSAAIKIDDITAIKIYWQNIHGAFQDAWEPADEKTGSSIQQILELTSTNGFDDVVPNTNTQDLLVNQNQPLSTIQHAEDYLDYDLTTDAKMEDIVFDIDEYFDALKYYTNGAKLRSLTGPIRSAILTPTHPTIQIREGKFTPKNVRYGNPHLFFGRRYIIPLDTTPHQVMSDAATTSGVGLVTVATQVRYSEWHPDFNQSRM